jgi:DNA-binding transcriptional regulator of glucitol operon
MFKGIPPHSTDLSRRARRGFLSDASRVEPVHSKYFSLRALVVHVALVAWLTMCILAAWWQVGRAFGGNSLSFLYAIEWPCFAVLGFFGWWALLHVEKPTEDEEVVRREYEERMRAEALAARAAEAALLGQQEDPELAAYNDHLADLSAARKKKLWGH